MTRRPHLDERDPVEPREWQPVSHAWRREDAKQATAEAVRRSKERRTTVNRPHDEEQL